jgi:hypothetical protein
VIAAALADAVVVLHLAFIAFAIAGGLLVLRRRRWIWAHLPALVWAVGIELWGGICPLTPLENRLRAAAGQAGYSGGFIDHYLLGILYPQGLDRPTQVVLGMALLALNAAVYTAVFRRARAAR